MPHRELPALELLHNESFYRHLVESSFGLICAHDLTGRLLMVNQAAAQAVGYQPEELVGRDLHEFIPDDAIERLDKYLARIAKYGQARGFLDVVTRSGKVLTWVYRNRIFEGAPVPLVIGHAQEMTWRLQMERNLRDSSERFRQLFEEAPVAYHEIDSEGVIRRVNRRESELLGRPKSDMVGRHVWEFVAPDQREVSREHVEKKLRGELLLEPFVRDYIRSDGQRRTVRVHENLIHSHDGNVQGIRSALFDVTAQLETEAELRRLNAELDRRVAERTAELHASTERLKEFVYTVSHDLQEPLRTVTAFANLLRTRSAGYLDADALEFLGFVVEGANRMGLLIRDLLAYSRVLHDKEPDSEPVDLNEALGSAKHNLGIAIQSSGAEIRCSELPVVRGQCQRMTQLFQNLLSNAVKYRSERPLVVEIACERAEGGWLLSVTDNGVGIPANQQERVFGLFKRAGGGMESGSGVGLAICKAIVEQHGGRIWVEAGNPHGAVFRFTLAD